MLTVNDQMGPQQRGRGSKSEMVGGTALEASMNHAPWCGGGGGRGGY